MTTPRVIIGDALDASGVIGLGQTSPADDVAKAFRYLDQIASQWSRRQWLPTVPETGFVDLDTDIGLLPDYDAALTYALAVRLRPAYQLPPDEALVALLTDAIDVIRKSNTEAPAGSTPRDLIALALKAAGALKPGQVSPVADVAEAYTLMQQIAAQWARLQYLPIPYVLPGLDATTGLAPDQNAALLYQLAMRLRPNYGLPPEETLAAMAEQTLATIRKSNVQPVMAPALGGFTANTPRALIALALKAAGALKPGQTAPVADVADAYALLQQIVGQWARKRWLVPHLADVAVLLPAGAGSLTIGPGGDVSRVRPDRIEAAFLRSRPGVANPLDYPLDVIDDREDWNRIALKSMRGWPAVLFYDTGFPLGTLNLYPTPQLAGAWELHLSVKDGVGAFGDLDAPISLPAEYEAALLYNLAARLRPHYGLPPEPALTTLALDALNTIRRANTQVPRLRMPPGLPGMRGRGAGAWQAGLVGGGGDPGFNQAQRFRVGISSIGGTDIVT